MIVCNLSQREMCGMIRSSTYDLFVLSGKVITFRDDAAGAALQIYLFVQIYEHE